MIRDYGKPLFSQGVLVDVTQNGRRTAVREERDRAQRLIDVAGTMITVIDADGMLRLLNAKGGQGPATPRRRRRPRLDRDRRARGGARGVGEALAEMIDGDQLVFTHEKRVATHTVRAHASDGTTRRNATTPAIVFRSSAGEDITERRESEQAIAHLAYHDPLTGLPNRALLEEHLEVALARAEREGPRVALLYLDLDDFKLVNDSLGHAAGDELLRWWRATVEDHPPSDLLARHGGDELLLLLTDLDDDRVARPEGREPIAAALASPSTSPTTSSRSAPRRHRHLSARRRRRRRAARHADAAMYALKRTEPQWLQRSTSRHHGAARAVTRPACARHGRATSSPWTTSRSGRGRRPRRGRGADPLGDPWPRARTAATSSQIAEETS